jgi:hypothetical protein
MNLAASDQPQIYIPADQPYAWVTMPMLFWMLGFLALGIVAAVGMAVVIVRRLNALEDYHEGQVTDLARSAARATADIVRVSEDVARIDADVELLFNAVHDHPDELEVAPDVKGPPTAPIEEVVTEAVDLVVAEAATTEWPVVEQRDIGGRTFSFRR